MKKVYITKANANRIIRKLDLKKADLEGDIYKEANQVLNIMFSKWEKQELLAYKKLMEKPEEFMDEIYEQVSPRKDTYRLVYEKDNPPAYHLYSECTCLQSGFKNYKIPDAIRFNGVQRYKNQDIIPFVELNREEKIRVVANVESYRKWWSEEEGEELYLENKEAFLMRVNLRFKPEPRIRNIEEFERPNSGIEEMENMTLIDVENMIDQLIKDSIVYYHESEKNEKILRSYANASTDYLNEYAPFLALGTGVRCTFKEIKEIVDEYKKLFTLPLKKYLKEYYRRKNNPDLGLDEKILKELGFKCCRWCLSHFPFDEPDQCQQQRKLPKLLDGYLDSDNWSEEMWAIWWEAHDYNEDQEEREMMEYEEKVLGMRRI